MPDPALGGGSGWVSAAHAIVAAAVVSAGACIGIRFLAPAVLHGMIKPVQDGIALVAIAILLPEYLVTTALRRFDRRPPRLAYDLGDCVSWLASLAGATVSVILGASSRAADSVHPAVVAVLAAGLVLGHSLGQW
jgi:hypothetical protein